MIHFLAANAVMRGLWVDAKAIRTTALLGLRQGASEALRHGRGTKVQLEGWPRIIAVCESLHGVVVLTGVPRNADPPESTLHPTTLRTTSHAQI